MAIQGIKNVTMDSRVLQVCGSINFKGITEEDKPKMLERLFDTFKSSQFVENYYYIVHDDTDTWHIHYIIEIDRQKRIKTLLHWLADGISVSPQAVNIQALGSLSKYLEYCLHWTNESKEEGKKEYVLTNWISNCPYDYIDNVIANGENELTAVRLIAIVLECEANKPRIMKTLGLKAYHKYRSEIRDICECEWSERVKQEKREDILKKELEKEIPF